jgi:ATP-dependent helicase HrpB
MLERGADPARDAAAIGQSDVLDRLDKLADAEAAGLGAALRSRGLDTAAARRVAQLRDELLRRDRFRPTIKARGTDGNLDEVVLKWLLVAYPDRVVKQRGAERTGVMVGGRGVRLSAESIVRNADLYLAIDAREDRRGGPLEVQVELASTIRLEWLLEFFPDAVRKERQTRYDETRRRVITANQVWYHDLLLREDLSAAVDLGQAGLVLADALRPQAARFLQDNARCSLWLARLEFVKRALPELSWPEFDDAMFAEVVDMMCQGKTSRDEVEGSDFVPFLQGRLTSAQVRELEESAPQTLTIPSGRAAKLMYETGRPPVLAARVQEVFGWFETPRLARGRVPVLLHLLGPNNRPVQITDDLHNFWTTTYHQVRKDLRARYPKHAWPEDPFRARASHGRRPS